MSQEIKYLQFRGIEKKEQIMFKSFLNLAKNELSYQLLISSEHDPDATEPSFIIRDERYEFPDGDLHLAKLPSIVIGSDIENTQGGYIARPAQWSDFKRSLAQLDASQSADEVDVERVLPVDVDVVLEKPAELSAAEIEQAKSVEQTEEDYEEDYDQEGEFDLSSVSSDYYSFTNSEYGKVAEEVQGYKADDAKENVETVILKTDDESGFDNSVLVLETNSFDAWDYSETEISVATFEDFDDPTFSPDGAETKPATAKASKKGLDVDPDEEYWLEDNEIIVDQHTLLFIKTVRNMVYSTKPPANWPGILQRRGLSKLPLRADWRPTEGYVGYPLESLIWVNTLIRDTSALADGLEEEGEYILHHWPGFNLLELDNILLKLCTMMFVRAESVQSLSAKSGYGRSTIIGLMNACHQMGLLIDPSELDASQMTRDANDEGVLGKIKDVFR